ELGAIAAVEIGPKVLRVGQFQKCLYQLWILGEITPDNSQSARDLISIRNGLISTLIPVTERKFVNRRGVDIRLANGRGGQEGDDGMEGRVYRRTCCLKVLVAICHGKTQPDDVRWRFDSGRADREDKRIVRQRRGYGGSRRKSHRDCENAQQHSSLPFDLVYDL